MNNKLFFLGWYILFLGWVNAQTELVFVFFKDKPNKSVFYANPSSELTQKSLDRRINLGIALNDQDAPLEITYIQTIQNLGFAVTDKSKWLNGVAVNATSDQILQLRALPFVEKVESFVKNPAGKIAVLQNKFQESATNKMNFNYGLATDQINQINLKPLHDGGYTGKGITIAVIDTGFPTVDTGVAYERLRTNGQIKGGFNYLTKNSDIYNTTLSSHGSQCLGTIGGYIEGNFVGSAPDADFYLYVTEDAKKEVPEEELYLIQAAEEADRKGVDIITVSLGYNQFDDARYNYTYSDMTGEKSFVARGLQVATEKGIFTLVSAGNEGSIAWKYITTPADNAKVFTIGAVTSTGSSSAFSSFGPNALGVVKPDAAARGTKTYFGYGNGAYSGDGTSYATPLAAGGVACLLQALPKTTSREEIKQKLRETASLYPNINNQKGYGILNFGAIYSSYLSLIQLSKSPFKIYPNPVKNHLHIQSNEEIIEMELYDVSGRKIKNIQHKNRIDIADLHKGIYLIKVKTRTQSYIEKLIKE